MRNLLWLNLFLLFAAACPAQYLGVTCGWQYSPQLTGPVSMPGQFNVSLYNPQPDQPNATWDNWAEQLDQAGVDFVCPNLTGSQPNRSGSPTNMAPLLASLIQRGLTNRVKFALFDDNAASWVAQWNQANGRGYGYAQRFDLADTNNWKYIYDYNYKLFYQTIPDPFRFKINGRPLLIIWTGNGGAFLANMKGNASQAILYVRQKCRQDFGFNPFIVLSDDFFSNDPSCTNAGVADAAHKWFTAGPGGPSYTLSTRFNTRLGVAVAGFQHPGQSGLLEPQHGQRFETGLSNTVDANALLTLCEGFTDYEEDAAMWRARNVDENGNALGYDQTLYDYPNQRINILRRHSNWPCPPARRFEAENCDTFGGAAGGNGLTNFYRNGNLAIGTNTDAPGGYHVGWIQPGEWLEWQEVPLQGAAVHLLARVASPNDNCQLHFVIDGTDYPALTLPNTGGWQTWTTVESGPFAFTPGGPHTIRLVCDTGGFNLSGWSYRAEIPFGVNVALQAAANHQWVSATASNLNAGVATAPGAAEQFTVVDAGAGYGYGHVALKSLANDRYVTVDTNGLTSLAADATAVGEAQIFRWTDNGDGTIGLRALANSKLISVTNRPASPLIASRFRAPGVAEAFSVTPVATNALVFIAPPNAATAASAITAGTLSEVQVRAVNAAGAPVAGAPVTLAVNTGTGILTGNQAVTDADGVAHFPALQLDKTGAKTLLASSPEFAPVVSSAFNILPGEPVSLAVETRADGTGEALAAQTIAAGASLFVHAIQRDALGNFVANAPVTWSLINLTGGVRTSDLTPAWDGSGALFIGHLTGSATIQAQGTMTAQSGKLTVVAGPAAGLTILQQPSATAQVGVPFAQQPIVSQMDAFGNPSATPVTVTLAGGGGGVNRQPEGVTVPPVNGVAAFSGLYLTNTGVSQLVFTAGTVSVPSANITTGIGNAAQLVWAVEPAQATNGFVFSASPVLQTQDAGGHFTTLGLPAVKYVAVEIYSDTGALLGSIVTNLGTSGGNGTAVLTGLVLNETGAFQLVARDLGNGFNPTNIPSAAHCRLWLDAADAATLAFTGSSVTRWSDKSGTANDATGAATTATNTLLNPASPGGAQTVHFNGGQQLLMNLNCLSNSPYTILVLDIGAAKAGGNSYFIGNTGGYSTDLTLGIGYQTATQFRWQHYADDLNYNAPFTNAVPRRWTMNLDATGRKRLSLDSVPVGAATGKFLTGTNLVNGYVGGNSYVGDLAEVIVYDTSLGAEEQAAIEDYLANKWLAGLSPAVSQPFLVVDPVYTPVFDRVSLDTSGGATAITFTGAGGLPNGSYRVLSATNLITPEWTPVLTNHFDATGAFTTRLPINPAEPVRFYRLAQP